MPIEEPEGFDPLNEDDPSVSFNSHSSELPTGEPRHEFDETTRAVAALRINALCEAAGLVGKGQPASDAMQRLARLVAQQCLDVLAQPDADQYEHSETIEQMFAVKPTVYEQGAGIAFQATLCNAPQLNADRTRELQRVFADSLLATLGDGEAVFHAYDAWIEGEGPKWIAAQNAGHTAVLARLTAAEGDRLALGRDLGAHFELEFIRDC